MSSSTANDEQQSSPFEVTVSKTDLLKELAITQSVVERRSTVPILSNFMFETFGNNLLITATDLDLSLRTFCPARVVKEGSCTVPARKLCEYVRLLGDGEITIKSLQNDWAQIRCGRSNTKMVGLPRKNFPSLPLYPAQSAIRLPAAGLRTLIARTIFAISHEESQYTLNGALLVLLPETITMVATDGHRLAHVQAKEAVAGAARRKKSADSAQGLSGDQLAARPKRGRCV